MQYLRHLRMQHAQELLRRSFLSIKEVAFLCGAKDLSHFVRAFKKEYGLTPSLFRVQNRSVGEDDHHE
jgi:AraC-like DNA-binding protein